MKKHIDQDTKPSVEERVEQIRNEASRHASMRLSRSSQRIQDGAFALASTWDERMSSQPARIKRLNEKLS